MKAELLSCQFRNFSETHAHVLEHSPCKVRTMGCLLSRLRKRLSAASRKTMKGKRWEFPPVTCAHNALQLTHNSSQLWSSPRFILSHNRWHHPWKPCLPIGSPTTYNFVWNSLEYAHQHQKLYQVTQLHKTQHTHPGQLIHDMKHWKLCMIHYTTIISIILTMNSTWNANRLQLSVCIEI